MTHALPDYLTRGVGFDDCPPGHRFGLYFNGWEADWRKPSNKTPAFKTVAGALPQHSGKVVALRRNGAGDIMEIWILTPAEHEAFRERAERLRQSQRQ